MSSERHSFYYEGREIYSWIQTLTEIELFIRSVPAGIRSKDLNICIEPTSVRVGVRSHRYLDHRLSHTVKASESIWTFDAEEREIHIVLVKAEASVVWPCVFIGHQQEGGAEEVADRKRLMLERFQAEHPGFDFRGAEFSGNVPDPKTFLREE